MLLVGPLAFAGSWSTEYSLEGMDSVHIYLPTTMPAVGDMRFSSAPWNYSNSSLASLCNDLAGSYESDLGTQIYSTI